MIGNETKIEWSRLFIRSGFRFKHENGNFDFSYETISNKEFLGQLLKVIKKNSYWHDPFFFPPASKFSQSDWLNAFNKKQSYQKLLSNQYANNCEINLINIDTYACGIVRWLNDIGIPTCESCDGHGRSNSCWIALNDYKQNKLILHSCLHLVSRGKVMFKGDRIRQREPSPDKTWMLDLAELIYVKREPLRDLVGRMRMIC